MNSQMKVSQSKVKETKHMSIPRIQGNFSWGFIFCHVSITKKEKNL